MKAARTTRLLLLALAASAFDAPVPAQHVPRLDSYEGVVVRILQSNNAGNVQHVIDPSRNEVVGVIEGCPRPHNLFAHPDGLYFYCTSEVDNTLDVFDTRTLQLVEQLPLTARPNKAAINKKHRKIYVGIAAAPFVDVFSLDTHEKLGSIPVTTGIHNVYVSPDGNWVVAGLNARSENSIEVIDPTLDEVVRTISLVDDQGVHHTVRPMAFLAGDDGSTDKLFAHGSGVNGIWVLDWETGETERMLFPPPLPAWQRNADGNQGAPMHGLEVLPDRSAVWASSRLDSRIYGWSLPDFKFLGGIEVGPTANWMTSTPDSRYMYVAVSGSDHTIAIDLETHDIVAKMRTGARPARIDVAILPPDRVSDLVSDPGSGSETTDFDDYRRDIEPMFARPRGYPNGGGDPACVMCHGWQTGLRLALEDMTETPDGWTWTLGQSRANYDVVTKLVNASHPKSSKLLTKPLAPQAGGERHSGGSFWASTSDPEYQAVLAWIEALPAEHFTPPPEPELDFEFYRSCVQEMIRTPKPGQLSCAVCHAGGAIGFAPRPADGAAWTEEEARRGFEVAKSLIVPGNPVRSRWMLKPLHPDGGGSYTHNGPRRWQSMDDPEWQMLAAWVRGARTGSDCSR